MKQPTLFLTVGLPCTGKTTAARRMEIEHSALRLTKDEWVKALYGHENPRSAQDVIEGRLIEIGLRALELGTNVVIDYGLWGRDERSALRQAAADRGAKVEMRYFEVRWPESRVGRRAITFAGLCVAGAVLLMLSFALGIVEPAQNNTDSWARLVWGLGIWACGVTAVITGLIAITGWNRKGPR